jgi:hypothetical protein
MEIPKDSAPSRHESEDGPLKRPLREVLGEYEGRQVFQAAQEVETERESWE